MPDEKSSSAGPPKADAARPPAAAPAVAPAPAPAAPPAAGPCAPPRAASPFLGHGQAVSIVCASARTIPANLARTLGELGVSGAPFQHSVRCAVTAAGYTLGVEDVPAAPGTRLIQVVTIIQNARRTA
jgi:hypothetical protein